jgi:hypothetical protein
MSEGVPNFAKQAADALLPFQKDLDALASHLTTDLPRLTKPADEGAAAEATAELVAAAAQIVTELLAGQITPTEANIRSQMVRDRFEALQAESQIG